LAGGGEEEGGFSFTEDLNQVDFSSCTPTKLTRDLLGRFDPLNGVNARQTTTQKAGLNVNQSILPNAHQYHSGPRQAYVLYVGGFSKVLLDFLSPPHF
jgi:hypothetical protein